ncbi:MAG TPA: hypothetical protein ENI23_00765 [bacterium]|nr:hypothetical protein [bacterium]
MKKLSFGSFKMFKGNKSFSLVEVLLAVSVFAFSVTALSGSLYYGQESTRVSGDRTRAVLLAEEGIEAVRNIRTEAYSNLVDGTYGLVISSNQWNFSGTEDITDIFTRQVVISSLDAGVKEIQVTITWQQNTTRTGSLTLTTYLTSWNTSIWEQTTQAEFDTGIHENTVTAATGDGEVQLGTIVFGDWCNPTWTVSEYDLPGQGVAQSIEAIQGEIFIGTGQNASGLAFADLTVTSDEPPIVTLVEIFDGHKTNDVFGETGFGYIGTDTNAKEVVIIDVATTPFAEEGYFDAPGNLDADSVFVVGDKGYVTAGSPSGSSLYIFDLTSKTGSRSIIGTGISLTGTGKSLVVSGDYAYIAIDDATTQLEVVDISDPLNLSIVAQAQLTAAEGVDVFINESNNRAYLATKTSTTDPEMHILDITNKTGNLPVIGTYDTAGMDPTGVTAIVIDNVGVIVGHGGAEQYQVIDLTDINNPTRCGGLVTTTGINGVASIDNFDGNSYSYVITEDQNNELKIIQGGPGGGFGGGLGYPDDGAFTSSVSDTTSAAPYYFTAAWDEQLVPGIDLTFQLRSGTTSDLTGVPWYGPDGTSTTFFTDPLGEAIPAVMQNNRYVQYKGYFTSDTIATPVLESFRVNYEK